MGVHQVLIQTSGPSNKVLRKMSVCEKLDIVAVKERFICSQDEGKSAFEELAVYCCQLEEALCDKKELAKTKILALKECNCHLPFGGRRPTHFRVSRFLTGES